MIRRYAFPALNLRFPSSTCSVRRISSPVPAASPGRKRGRPPKSDEDKIKTQSVKRVSQTRAVNDTSNGESVARKRSRAIAAASTADVTPTKTAARTTKRASRSSKTLIIPRRRNTLDDGLKIPRTLLGAKRKHHDLASFRLYAVANKVDPESNVFKGTLYEYKVLDVLTTFNLELKRTGQSKDGGVDLAGQWNLPIISKADSGEIKVIVQCKNCKPRPGMIRELEGSYTDGIPGWKGEKIFRLLVANGKNTPGVREAIQSSPLPMGYMYCTPESKVKQFFWNDAARRAGLEGITTAMEYSEPSTVNKEGRNLDVRIPEGNVVLVWNGRPWPPKKKRSRKLKA